MYNDDCRYHIPIGSTTFNPEDCTVTDFTYITVNNVGPSVFGGAPSTSPILPGTLTSFDKVTFTDPGFDCEECGTFESFTATVDYGDGTPSSPLPLNSDKTFELNHTYPDDDSYTVTVTVSGQHLSPL